MDKGHWTTLQTLADLPPEGWCGQEYVSIPLARDLVEMDLAKRRVDEKDGKEYFRITDGGRAALKECEG